MGKKDYTMVSVLEKQNKNDLRIEKKCRKIENKWEKLLSKILQKTWQFSKKKNKLINNQKLNFKTVTEKSSHHISKE